MTEKVLIQLWWERPVAWNGIEGLTRAIELIESDYQQGANSLQREIEYRRTETCIISEASLDQFDQVASDYR